MKDARTKASDFYPRAKLNAPVKLIEAKKTVSKRIKLKGQPETMIQEVEGDEEVEQQLEEDGEQEQEMGDDKSNKEIETTTDDEEENLTLVYYRDCVCEHAPNNSFIAVHICFLSILQLSLTLTTPNIFGLLVPLTYSGSTVQKNNFLSSCVLATSH